MNALMAVPLAGRLAAMLAVGVCVGAAVNWAAYRLAWHPRRISPWSAPEPNAPARGWSDRLPVVGWLGLRREVGLHGRGFWVRPMLIELACGLGFAALYWWQIEAAGLLPAALPRPVAGDMVSVLHVWLAGYLVFIALLLAASLIDLDERIIPDAITVPGTLAGLVLAAVYPMGLLPAVFVPPGAAAKAGFWQLVDIDRWVVLRATTPGEWPVWLDGRPAGWALLVALVCWWLWCVALMPRTWYPRHGYGRAFRLTFARLARERATYWLAGLGAIGSVGLVGLWLVGGPHWRGLLSALIGMAAGGAMIWSVRIVGTAALRREAMGFGDVTLMAMIGAFLGWQACLIVFFLAPFAGLVVGALQLILWRDSQIPYGPFLSLAAIASIVYWAPIWDRAYDVFALGWWVPGFLVVCLVVMVALLVFWRLIRDVMGW